MVVTWHNTVSSWRTTSGVTCFLVRMSITATACATTTDLRTWNCGAPRNQRVNAPADLLDWAREVIALYEDLEASPAIRSLANEDSPAARSA